MTSALPLPSAGRVAEVWRDRLSLLLESTGEGIFGIDLAGDCVFVNRSAAEQLGWPAERILGRNMHALIHHTHADGRHYPECDCPIFNAFRRGLPCRIDDEVLWRADGSAFSAEYSSYPILEGGAVQGAVVTFVDIGDRKRAEELLRRTNDELESRVARRTAELSAALDQLRELGGHLEAVRESERMRIAREVHDELGSLLVALKMDVDWLAHRVGDRPALAGKCQGMGRLIDTAVDNVGRIITDLRPSILDHQGLWAALEWQAAEFYEASGFAPDLRLHVPADVAPPESGVAIAVFRIFQEILSNVGRHARAGATAIRIAVDGPPDPVLYLDVRDDGIGAAPTALADPRSWGVVGMRERAGHYGGTLTIEGAPGAGTRVRLKMPLARGPGEPAPLVANRGAPIPSAITREAPGSGEPSPNDRSTDGRPVTPEPP